MRIRRLLVCALVLGLCSYLALRLANESGSDEAAVARPPADAPPLRDTTGRLTRTDNLVAYGVSEARPGGSSSILIVDPDRFPPRRELAPQAPSDRYALSVHSAPPDRIEFISSIAWSPDGRQIAYVIVSRDITRLSEGDAERSLWTVALHGGGPTRIATGVTAGAIDWGIDGPVVGALMDVEQEESASPDGRRIAFRYTAFEGAGICIGLADAARDPSNGSCLGSFGFQAPRLTAPRWSPA